MGVLREHQDLRKKKRIGAGKEVRTRDLNLGKVAVLICIKINNLRSPLTATNSVSN